MKCSNSKQINPKSFQRITRNLKINSKDKKDNTHKY